MYHVSSLPAADVLGPEQAAAPVAANSEYTVGVTGAYSWVVMYGDCPHKINPSLICDFYHKLERSDF